MRKGWVMIGLFEGGGGGVKPPGFWIEREACKTCPKFSGKRGGGGGERRTMEIDSVSFGSEFK